MQVFKLIENEIDDYISRKIQISEGYWFSQYDIIKRIMIFANNIYPKGKLDKQGKYKYWIDITSPRIDSEVKNIDFDTKDIKLYSDSEKDSGAMMILNLALKKWLRENKQASEINDSIEESSGWGNVVWKQTKEGYEKVDLKNFYVVNQIAKTLEDTPAIEKHILTQSELRKKKGIWNDNVETVIKECGNKGFKTTPKGTVENKETLYYEIYERNGEVSEEMLFAAQDKEGGDKDKFVLAKIVCAGLSASEKSGKYILFAEEISKMPYKEYHRGRYNGRWFRLGLIEILFDIQTRANEISNQIARGLEWASKTIFRTQDDLLANNILTEMKNGDIIKSTDLQKIDIRMNGLDQLIADWNRLMQAADRLCNSYEVVTGESLPSGTPFRLGSMINQNATKLFTFLREKLAQSVQDIFQDWILPDLMKDLKKEDVISLTGEEDGINKFYEVLVNGWYLKNLPSLPPHNAETAMALKQQKFQELSSGKGNFVKLEKDWLKEIKPRVSVIISGENINIAEEMESLASFIQLEADPIRRTALIEMAMKKKGIDVEKLPKNPPQQAQAPQGASQGAGQQQATA